MIPLDEILKMEKNDFYDEIHTTPQGSERIANTIFPLLANFFENKKKSSINLFNRGCYYKFISGQFLLLYLSSSLLVMGQITHPMN